MLLTNWSDKGLRRKWLKNTEITFHEKKGTKCLQMLPYSKPPIYSMNFSS